MARALHRLLQHSFTACEDSSVWSEAAVDPEMLGKAFESLMAPPERKSTGAFYTPQVLVEQLTTSALADVDIGREVKVLDPACGSGAFLIAAYERLEDAYEAAIHLLRLAGKGSPGPFGGPRGDLYIQATLVDDPVFSVEGQDLVTHRDIKLTEALLGTTISVPTLDDKQYHLKIPPGTKSGTKMRLPGHGLPAMQGGKRGDLYVRLHIQIPKTLSSDQRELLKKLTETGI